MIPAALASQLELGLADFLRMSFWSSTPGMEGVIDRLIATPGAVCKGPYVSVKLPFARGAEGEFFPEVPLGFPAHRHQEQAFRRLSGASPASTIIATGTGSGKTECFLWPILDHCRQQVGVPGIKAILVYPMNALATDQAGRIAQAIHGNPALRGAVRAGLYIGESPGEKASRHKGMGEHHLITDRKAMQLDPPDILLTNYKMLDYLLIRPKDQPLWQHNQGGPLRFLVVDELHTFDGAQGTDLACLVRRLKARLGVGEGDLCCVGTSATLGSGAQASAALRSYAGDVFGEPFDEGAVIGEQRLSPADFFGDHLITYELRPEAHHKAALDPSAWGSPAAYALAQQRLWFGSDLAHAPGTDAWYTALGDRLLQHSMTHNLVKLLRVGPVPLAALQERVAAHHAPFREDAELARWALVSFLSLVSQARSWVEPGPDADPRAASVPRRTRPFLEVRLQLWQRELRRMVADLRPRPTLRFSDDLTDDQRDQHLPLVHCRDCGALGWATVVQRDKPDVYRSGLSRFYRAFFGNDPQVRFLWPEAAAPSSGDWAAAPRIKLHPRTLVRQRDGDDVEGDEAPTALVVSGSTVTVDGRQQLSRDCPFCGARDALAVVGFRAATLTSVYIDQLFASPYNDDKKLLTFSDSVQDAAHRAGFFGARTWRFNLRVALAKVLEDAEGASLASLPAAFVARWRGAKGLSPTAYAVTFLAPNMAWFREYEALQQSGELPEGASLLQRLDRRIAYEIYTEFSHQTRIGRSLPRTGTATVSVCDAMLDAAVDALCATLREEVGGLRDVQPEPVRRLLLGALHRLREQGGLLHPELPADYVTSGGRDTFVFNRPANRHLPSYGRTSRYPALLTDDPRASRFSSLIRHGSTWYERWVQACLGSTGPLIGHAGDVWDAALAALTAHGLLAEVRGQHGRVWGVRPEALRVSSRTVRLRCDTCSHGFVATAAEAAHFTAGMPCLTARCPGRYTEVSEGPSYFQQLYARGEVERVFTAEHTGLLTRGEREAVEAQFKASAAERQPWFANLLSCTPTLEMGINIGALSTAVLCSVPPAQANYLQRIGRAGRRDGNSLLLTIAQGRPHDMYFFARPEEMISGEVSPPGVFLNASAVLERQLAAFCFDRWNAAGVVADAIPRRLSRVFDTLDDLGSLRFPHNWLAFVREHDAVILADFLELFGDRVDPPARDHLRTFLLGEHGDAGSLGWNVLDLLRGERKQRDALRSQANKVRAAYDKLKRREARDRDHDDQLALLDRERAALDRLVKQIEATPVLQFLTDHGLLPNYAFPESPIRLRSVIWRRKEQAAAKGSNYETQAYEYARPAMAAISELAPENRFFAGGRHVTIDQVDVATSTIETWRFCDQCSYSERHEQGTTRRNCPACGSSVWGERSQLGQLLKLEQVFASTSDRRSRIGDEQDERQPRHYNRRMLMSFSKADRDGAWRLSSATVPFAFEYLRRARFREVNFGTHADEGAKVTIAGREEVRQGFVICRHCGKVQPPPPKASDRRPPGPQHALWCPARKADANPDDFEAAVYLYREFSSEAIRILMPLSDLGTERQLNSFLAAFQLGLRDKYGGRVDHLHTMVDSEPESDGFLRRQYLVLYDSVPGGTGYLKDFTRPPEDPDAPHPLFDIMQRAVDRMTRCVCTRDPDLDGCYRCIFAYRNASEMADTSSNTAVELFTRILAEQHTLNAVDALSDVSVTGMMDSVLEARFIEALRRLGHDDASVRVDRAHVGNKSGFRLRLGDAYWTIEPQVGLGAEQGIKPGVSIDFLLRPATPGSTRLPVAVFLDGFAYHDDRIGLDLLQRMTLLTTGRYDVCSLTWHDIDQAFHRDVPDAPFLLHDAPAALKPWFRKLQRPAEATAYEATAFHSLVRELREPEAADLATRAAIALASQMQAPGTVSVSAWRDDVRQRVPAVVWPFFDEVDEGWLLVRREPTSQRPFGLWAAAPASALRGGLDPTAFRVLAWLDDAPARREDPAFAALWRGFLHLAQHLRALPKAWFLTETSRHKHDYATLAQLRSFAPEAFGLDAWLQEEEVDPDFVPLLRDVVARGAARPEVGIDLPDGRGLPCGVPAELVWLDPKVAVLRALDAVRAPVPPGWQVFELAQLASSLTPLLAALNLADGEG